MRHNYYRLSWPAYHQKLSNNDDPVDGAFKWHCEESVNNICGENTLTKVSLNNRGISVDFFFLSLIEVNTHTARVLLSRQFSLL